MNGKYQIYLGRRLGGAAGWSCNRVLSYEASLPVCPDFAATTCHTKFHIAPLVQRPAGRLHSCEFGKFINVIKPESFPISAVGWAPALLLPPHFYHCWQRPPGLGWAGPGHADLCLNTPEPLTRPLPGPA